MTLLEVINKAIKNQDRFDSQSDYPLTLTNDGIFANLKPKLENPNSGTLINPISGWEMSKRDAQVIDLVKGFSSKLRRKLKDTNRFGEVEFVTMLKQFLDKIGEKVGVASEAESNELSDGLKIDEVVEKNGFLMGRDVSGLVLRGSVSLEMWELVETLISKSLVDHSLYPYLVSVLVEKQRSDLLCAVIKRASDLEGSELLLILKYFLCPSKEAVSTIAKVRDEWDSQCLLAIEKMGNKEVLSKVAEEASILLMVAHDGFLPSELCLHFLLASPNVNEVFLASAVSMLSGNEMSSFIRYLSKWMKKYERFPQAGPCPEASKLGLKLCDWVPKLENITNCLGIVIDEKFSTLALHSELHEELKSIKRVADGLASESRVCEFVANVVERLRRTAAHTRV